MQEDTKRNPAYAQQLSHAIHLASELDRILGLLKTERGNFPARDVKRLISRSLDSWSILTKLERIEKAMNKREGR